MGAALLSAIPAVIQLGTSISQSQKAKKYGKAKRPFQNYPIPQPIIDNVNAAKLQAGVTGLPGQGTIEDKLRAGQVQSDYSLINSQQSPSAVAAGISANDKNFMNTEANLGVKGAEFKNQNQRILAGANMDLAKAMEHKYNADWEWNDKLPYLQNMASASAMKEASMRNSMNAFNDIAKIGVASMDGGKTVDPNASTTNPTTPGTVATTDVMQTPQTTNDDEFWNNLDPTLKEQIKASYGAKWQQGNQYAPIQY